MFWGYQRRGVASGHLLCPTGPFVRWPAARRDEGRYATVDSTVPVNRGTTGVLGLVVCSSIPMNSGGPSAIPMRTVATSVVMRLFYVDAGVRGLIWL